MNGVPYHLQRTECIFIFMSKWIVDRIEADIAVLENIQTANNTEKFLSALPQGVKEGDALIFNGKNFVLDSSQEAEERKQRIQNKFERLKSQ